MRTTTAMGLAERLIDSTDWGKYEICGGGPANRLAPTLRAFINSGEYADSMNLWWEIENVAFAQQTLYGAAEPVCEVAVVALADERPLNVRLSVVEVLRSVLMGEGVDPGLAERCRERVRLGVWLLAREAGSVSGDDRLNVLEVIRLVDPTRAEFVAQALAEEPPRLAGS